MGRKRDPKPRRVTVIRYYAPDGRHCAKGTPGATRKKEKSDTYYVELPPREKGGERERISLKTSDIGAAWKALRDLLARRAREDAGLEGPELAHAVKPIGEHIDDWIAQLRAAGRTGEEQIALLGARVRKLSELAGWERLPQINRDSALKALQRLQAEGASVGPEGRKKRVRASAQTRNHYLRHLKQFATWCVNEGRMQRSPVQGIEPVNVEIDRRHPRRSPNEEEVAALMAHLEDTDPPAPIRCRMTGPQRALGYRVCMATGFRADELRSLTRESFDLEHSTVTCRAAHTKNRKLAVQMLPAWLVEELRVWFGAGGGCWSDFPANWPGRVLLADQEAAGVAHKTEEGYFDFHSLRVWYVTWAASRPGMSPKTLQAMARHSDPRLTLKVYARPVDAEIRKAVDELPRPGR